MPPINGKAAIDPETTGELHIAGIVVLARYERLTNIKGMISLLPGAEIHAETAEGKLVVTLEGAHSSDVACQLNAIHAMPGVYSAALVYQHHEDVESLNEGIVDEADPSRIH